jgi:hypothetical protein
MKPNQKYIKVHWRDATSVDAWTAKEDIEPVCHLICTLGALVKESEDALVVALNHDSDEGSYSQFITIPKAWIVEKRFIKG